ncbi:MAG: flippase [Promethearchaeota archaeon]
MNFKSLLFDNKTVKQTIFKNTFWLMLAEGISKGLMFFLTILIARYLGAAGYGKFSFAFAFVSLFAVIADFGLSTLTIREVARDKSLARKYIDNIAVIKLILGIITFVLIITVIQFLGKTPEIRTLVYLAGIWVIIQSFTQFFQSIFRAFEKMQYEALSKIAYSIILFLITGFVLWQNLGIKFLVSAYIIAAIIAFVFTLILVRKKFTKFWAKIDFRFWKSLLKEAWPFALAFIFISAYYQIDTIMLSVMKTDNVVGWYNAAYKFLLILLVLPSISQTVIFPKMSQLFISSKNHLKQIYKQFLKYILIISFPTCIGIMLLAKRFISLVYGLEFIPSTIILQILIWSFLFASIGGLFGNLLNSCNKQLILMKITGIALIINILLNFLLIPQFSYIGASIATDITRFFVIVTEFLILSRIGFSLQKKMWLNMISKIVFSGLIMTIFIEYFRNINLLLLVFLSMFLYFMILYLMKGFNKSDVLLIRRIMS